MKYFVIVPTLLFTAFLFSSVVNRPPASRANPVITMCGTINVDWQDTSSVNPGILPGLGNLHFAVTTKSAEAQQYFDQGLRLIYGFNHWEAIQSFRHAIKLDPEFAMGYWGLALAYGPNLNDVNPQDREKIAFDAIQSAAGKQSKCTKFEKAMIDAMSKRYDGKAYDDRSMLNSAYSEAMRAVAKNFPDEAEALVLAADGIMNTMPWDYWQKDGTAKPATLEAKSILETALKKFPQHSGAHHLYIHLVEASTKPDQALMSAKFLETSMPGAGHIVHMPAHIYLRTGDYDRAITLNEQAAKTDEVYLSGSNNAGLYRLMYYPHNVDFIAFGSYMRGRSDLAVRTAMKLAYKGGLVSAANPGFGQYLMAEPMIAYVRFGKWNDILSLPQPDNDLIYTRLIWHFARGMAFLRSENISQAETELTQLDSLASLEALKSFYFSFNPASDIAKVPVRLLKGELLIRQGKSSEGIEMLAEAVASEDALRYNEPPDWKIFSRHFLGAALADAEKFAEAEKVFNEDLKRNPGNGWSLKGLESCLQKTKKNTAEISKRFATSWKDADVKISAARF
jgi:tetratricopeptide (TPR) repeat protein